MKSKFIRKELGLTAALFVLAVVLLPLQGCEMPAEYEAPEGPPAEEAPPGF